MNTSEPDVNRAGPQAMIVGLSFAPIDVQFENQIYTLSPHSEGNWTTRVAV